MIDHREREGAGAGRAKQRRAHQHTRLRRWEQPKLTAIGALFGAPRAGARLDAWRGEHTRQENDKERGRRNRNPAALTTSRAHEFLKHDKGFSAFAPSNPHHSRAINVALDAGLTHCFYPHMSTVLIEIRRARPADAKSVADTHDEAWRAAYQGIIPGRELDRLISRRGPDWWDGAIRKGSRISILVFGETIAGYANYGRNRARSLYYDGEIYELYLRPEFQGLGFGRRLFTAARRDLAQSGMTSLVVWALSDNDPAVGFYRALGGKAVARSSEKFGDKQLDKVAYSWN